MVRNSGEIRSLVNCWWECKLVQLLWKIVRQFLKKLNIEGFPGGAVVKSPPADAGDTGSSPGLRGSHMPRSN